MAAQAAPFYFQHALDFLKGWPSPSAVDMVGTPSGNVTVSPLYGGRVVHVSGTTTTVTSGASNTKMLFEAGALGTQMPIFLIQGSADFDVANPAPSGGSGAYDWYAIAPAGWMSGLVAIGAYELESTEYDQTATYNVNDPLHSPTEGQIVGADKTKAGMLFNKRNWPGGATTAVVQYVDALCGIVSRGARVNSNRQSVLTFWPYFLPGQDATH